MQRANNLLDILIAGAHSTRSHAGYHMPNIIQRLIEFQGDLPEPSGADKPDDKMLNEIRMLVAEIPHLKLASDLFSTLPEVMQRVSLNGRYYLTDDDGPAPMIDGERYTIASLSAKMEMNPNTFKQVRKLALERLEGTIEGALLSNSSQWGWLEKLHKK